MKKGGNARLFCFCTRGWRNSGGRLIAPFLGNGVVPAAFRLALHKEKRAKSQKMARFQPKTIDNSTFDPMFAASKPPPR
ncbi:hypothetical protein LMIY3S_02565 [Labrys miyagiensis]